MIVLMLDQGQKDDGVFYIEAVGSGMAAQCRYVNEQRTFAFLLSTAKAYIYISGWS